MADTDFYNLNLYRPYPLTDYPSALSATWSVRTLVDVGLQFPPDSGFDSTKSTHYVAVSAFNVTGADVTLTLKVTAPGTAVHNVTIDIVGTKTQALYTRSNIQTTYDATRMPILGFVIWGDLSRAATTSLTGQTAIVERRCVQSFAGHYVTSISAANQPRTTVTSPAEPATTYVTLPVHRCASATSGFWFEEGYNCQITVVPSENTIQFGAGRGAGAGEACYNRARTADEQAALAIDPTAALDGATRCYDAITNIDGVEPDEGGQFNIVAGYGIQVTTVSEHAVRISAASSLQDCGA